MVQTIEVLNELVEKGSENMDVRNKEQVISRMKAAVASKQFGQEDFICSLVADVYLPTLVIINYPVNFFLQFMCTFFCVAGMHSSLS